MILNELQGKLETQYDLIIPYEVDAFVSHDIEVAKTLAKATNQACQDTQHPDIEVVFIRQDEFNMEFTLYLDNSLMQAFKQTANIEDFLKSCKPGEKHPTLDDICTVVEGVSHVVCLLWHAHNDRQLRPVDLELQAEIDKYLVLLGTSDTLTQHRQIHKQLFSQCQLTSTPGTALFERYRTANNLAARYCGWLSDTFFAALDKTGLDSELARFYRLSGQAKFDRIRRLH